jgi:hypothetical protein
MPEHADRRNVALAVAVVVDGRPHYVIAAEVGINPSTFSGFVSGRVDPTPEQRAAIAAVLGRNESELFTEVSA